MENKRKINMSKMLDERKTINDNVVKWIKKRVNSKYADDVSLVLIYGSYINGTANEKSDVDCYFIPKTEKGYSMGIDFIIKNTGYDIFPMTWSRVKSISELHEGLLPLLGDAKIIYYNEETDLREFKKLQENMQINLNNAEYRNSIVKEKFINACNEYSKMTNGTDSIKIKKNAGNIIMILADAAALYNGDYFHLGLKKQYDDLQTKFLNLPEDFVKEYDAVTKSNNDEEYKKHCYRLLTIFGEYTGLPITCSLSRTVEKGEVKTNYEWLAGLYEEICSTFNKIYYCCEQGNYSLAFLSAVCLQGDLDDAVEFGGHKYDLLNSYQYDNLKKLAQKTKETEDDFVRLLELANVNLKKFSNFEEFIEANL